MARVVLGLGSSHGPTLATPPERVLELGQKDRTDPRLNYEALLRWAKPDIERELDLDVIRERHARCQAGIATTRGLLEEANADAIVVFSNLHGQTPDYQQQMLAIFLGDSIPSRGDEGVGHGRPASFRSEPRPQRVFPCDAELSRYIHESLCDNGFDIHSRADARAAGMGHEFTEIYDFYATDGTLPMVPFMISRALPNEASPKRCYQLGQAVRQAVEAWESDKRVVLMASGGLSHQVLDEQLDTLVVEALVERDTEVLFAIPRDRLNFGPGTPEILNWIAVAGAMEEVGMTLVDYVPCYRSPASTGQGVTFGYWPVA